MNPPVRSVSDPIPTVVRGVSDLSGPSKEGGRTGQSDTTRQLPEPRYFGGPLDGQAVPQFRGRWSSYRDEHGAHLPSKKGDVLAFPARPVPLVEKTVYWFVDDAAEYVWIPDWRAWRQTPAGRRSA